MNVPTLLAAAGAILTLSAGVALASEACGCCKEMVAESPHVVLPQTGPGARSRAGPATAGDV